MSKRDPLERITLARTTGAATPDAIYIPGDMRAFIEGPAGRAEMAVSAYCEANAIDAEYLAEILWQGDPEDEHHRRALRKILRNNLPGEEEV